MNRSTTSQIANKKMKTERNGGKNLRCFHLIFTILLWTNGIAVISVALWLLLDPKRNYVLDFIDFSDNFPYLKAATYIACGTGFLSVLLGFVGCFGAIGRRRCLLVGFLIGIVLLLVLNVAFGILSIYYWNQFDSETMRRHMVTMTRNRYGRDEWVQPLMDKIQFYNECCGGEGAKDYHFSFWFVTNKERGTMSYVPISCCKQTITARYWLLAPIDPNCDLRDHSDTSFSSTAYNEGCSEKVLGQTRKTCLILLALSAEGGLLMVFMLFLTLCFLNKIVYYRTLGTS
ncbi:unnamed protein product [Auanema sp. JU1783]|nr:unnamed protein product [Auanema sp. JU1783]